MKEKYHLAKTVLLAVGMLIIAASSFAQTPQDNGMQDMAFWSVIRDSKNPALFKEYLQKFPDGAFTLMAREKLKTLSDKPGTTEPTALPDGVDLRKRAKNIYPVDLDGNGSIEEVLLVPSGRTEFGQYYSLAVIDENGGVIWAGPTELNEDNPLVFGEWEFGISLPELVADIELDGAIELIAPAMQSDVSPTFFRVLRWQNKAFKPVRTAMLMQKPGAREFLWIRGDQPGEGIWVSAFHSKEKPGEFTVGTMKWNNGDVIMRRAQLWSVSSNSYVVHSWLKDKNNSSTSSTPASGIVSLLQQADEIMSRAYRESDDTRRNNQAAEALQLYRQAAKLGSAKAHYNIGFLYEIGTGIAKDNDTAIRYYEKAASLGYLEAYPQIILVQNQFRNYRGAAKTFFKYYRADPTLALAGIENNSYNPRIFRAIQSVLRSSGHYHGSLDGDAGPATRAAIAAYDADQSLVSSQPALTAKELAIELQSQLHRVGCYSGKIDGLWGDGSIRALRNFNHWAGKKLSVRKPTTQSLQAVSVVNGKICGTD